MRQLFKFRKAFKRKLEAGAKYLSSCKKDSREKRERREAQGLKFNALVRCPSSMRDKARQRAGQVVGE